MLEPEVVEAPQPAAGRTGLLAPERAPLTVGLVLVITMGAFEALAIATVLPVAQEELGGLGLYGLVFVSFMLASLAGIWIAGRESDRRGPAMPMAVGLAIFAAGLVIGGAAPEMSVLIVGRAVQGLGAGFFITVAYVAIGRGYDESLRPRMFAILSSAWVIPGLIGPSIAGAIAEYLSWRLVFFGLLPLIVVGAATTLPYLRKMGPPEAHAPSQGVLALVRGNASILRGVLVLGLLMMTFFGAEAYLPLTLTEVRNQGATIAGLALSAGTIFWTAGSWLQERRADIWSRRTFITIGLALVGAGIALLIPLALGAPIWLAAVSWCVAGFGIGMAYPVSTLSILGAAPSGQEGAASSAIQMSSVLGTAVGAGIGGAIVAMGASGAWTTETSVTLVFASMLVFVGVAIAVARGLRQA